MAYLIFNLNAEEVKIFEQSPEFLDEAYLDLIDKYGYSWMVHKFQDTLTDGARYIIYTTSIKLYELIKSKGINFEITLGEPEIIGSSLIFGGDLNTREAARTFNLHDYFLEEVKRKYIDTKLTDFQDRYKTVFEQLAKLEFRYFIILASAYIEEIVKDCLKSSFENPEKFLKSMSHNLRARLLHANG